MKALVFVTVLVFSLSGSASAQSAAEGTVRGLIHDQQGAVLPGVSVTATSPTVVATFTAISGEDGSYRLLNLSPGEYSITAELQGFSKYVRPGIVIRAGLNIAVDIILNVGAMSETVQVTAESPMLEVQKPVQSVNVSGDMQRSLPLGTRKDFSEFLEITPGVTARTFDQGTGGQVYMLRGSEIENHVVQVDGADMGSFRQGWAGLYVGLSTDSIDDTQVKTGGVDASAPLGVGVVINIATPSGTNRLKGAASTIYQARAWNDNNAASGAQSVYNKSFQPDLSLGGPILRDKLFFFGAFRYADRETGIFRTENQLKASAALDPTFTPWANGGKNKYYYIKTTAQLSPNHQVYVFYQRDHNPELASFSIETKPFNIAAFGGNGVGARLSSVWGSSITTKLLAAYNDKSLTGSFDDFSGGHFFNNPEQDIYTSAFVSGPRVLGSGQLVQTNTFDYVAAPTSKLTFQGDLTYFKSGWIGSHEFQTGFFAQPRLSNETDNRYVNGGASLEELALVDPNNLNGGTYLFRRRVYDLTSVVASSRLAQDYAGYVQDAWKPSSRLTIDAGIRIDKVMVRDRVYNVDVQSSWEIGPRVGATYVLTADEKNIVRANYGRVSDLPQPGYLPTAGGTPISFTDTYFNKDGTQFGASLPTPAPTLQNSNLIVDPNRHQPFIDEWILGYRRQLPGQISVDASFIRRYYEDRPANVETNGIYTNGVFSGFKNVNQNQIYLQTNNTWNTMVYSGFEVSVAKRTSRLNLLGGYTRGFQHLDGTWVPNDPASFIQPSAFPNDRGIGSIRGNEQSTTNNAGSLSGTADTRSPSWQKHAFRSGAAYNGPWGLTAATNLVFLSGPYSGPIVNRLASSDPAVGLFGPPTITLSNGRVVGNPLSTTIRFANATRGDGQIKAPNLIIWNIRVGRTFNLAAAERLTVALDGINVLNRAADQLFQSGGNQLYSSNYAIAPDGSFRGLTRQPPRAAQFSIRFEF
jgi:hypothetical protein